MPKPKAYDSTKERNKDKGKERKEILFPTDVIWDPLLLPLIYK